MTFCISVTGIHWNFSRLSLFWGSQTNKNYMLIKGRSKSVQWRSSSFVCIIAEAVCHLAEILCNSTCFSIIIYTLPELTEVTALIISWTIIHWWLPIRSWTYKMFCCIKLLMGWCAWVRLETSFLHKETYITCTIEPSKL